MRTLGAKVPNWLYEKYRDMDVPISEAVREALVFYLKHSKKPSVNQVNHIIEEKFGGERDVTIEAKIDRLLDAFSERFS